MALPLDADLVNRGRVELRDIDGEFWRIEPYYARQEDQHASTAHLNRVGVILKLCW